MEAGKSLLGEVSAQDGTDPAKGTKLCPQVTEQAVRTNLVALYYQAAISLFLLHLHGTEIKIVNAGFTMQ